MRRRLGLVLAAVLALTSPGSVTAGERALGDTTVFTMIGAPGMPEGIAVRDGLVYVGTHYPLAGNRGAGPSKIFVYDVDTRALVREFTIVGQDLGASHGLLWLGFDAAGRLYAVDHSTPSRVLRIDTTTGAQTTYATIPDLPACRAVTPQSPCSPTTLDQAPFPDGFAFDAAGNMYVTDLEAAVIYRIPPHTGTIAAEVWFADARFDGIFGINGIVMDPSGTRLFFAMTGSQQADSPAQGIIYSLPLVERPTAADLKTFFTYLEPAAGPDGIAFGASGKLYVALAGSNQLSILNPDGTEAARFPDAITNASRDVPYDLPASAAFDGKGSVLLTNQSFFTATPEHWAVLDVWVGDIALPLIEPDIP